MFPRGLVLFSLQRIILCAYTRITKERRSLFQHLICSLLYFMLDCLSSFFSLSNSPSSSLSLSLSLSLFLSLFLVLSTYSFPFLFIEELFQLERRRCWRKPGYYEHRHSSVVYSSSSSSKGKLLALIEHGINLSSLFPCSLPCCIADDS